MTLTGPCLASGPVVEQSVIHRAFRYRLAPTAQQETAFWQFAGVTRLIYNLALEQRRNHWRQYQAQTGRRLNYVSQSRQVTQLRAEFDWIEAVPCGPQHQAVRDLEKAFANFFTGLAGFPTPRVRGRHDTFRFQARDVEVRRLNGKWSAVRVPKIGWVKFRDTRPIAGRGLRVTISHQANGWHISFNCEIDHEAAPSALPAVGIDRGIANTVALSTGELLSTPCTAALERRKKRAQRILARRQRGSARYHKQRHRLSRITAKIARVRADWRHKATTNIAQRFGAVAIEDLNTVGMTRAGKGKRSLNRSILEQGWAEFEAVLAYKLDERGAALVKVNPAYTSQTCSECGTTDKASRENQARFACRHCGFVAHADTNAAINILRRRSPVMPVEVAVAAVEAGTNNHVLAA